MRLLLGEHSSGGGISGAPPCAYFPHEPEDPSRMTLEVLQEAAPTAEEWELLRETGRLGIEAEALYRPFSTLSNGERTKALLAALFCGEERYLLIDEPTNHLDGAGRAMVSRWLRELDRGFLLVSHDRAFLDGCVDHVMALNRTGWRSRAEISPPGGRTDTAGTPSSRRGTSSSGKRWAACGRRRPRPPGGPTKWRLRKRGRGPPASGRTGVISATSPPR